MKGLALAEEYYRAYGAPMIEREFGAHRDRIAAGLAGPGSECLGFDDEVSRDHDWGPAFCLWLTGEDYELFGKRLAEAYSMLPPSFMGFGPRVSSPGEEWRVGVARTADFYRRFTGLDRNPGTLNEWLRIPEQNLATCTNGKVFHDPLGEFTRRRGGLLAFYPEDVRLKKVASRCLTIAQAGQYNFERSMKRGDLFAARYAEARFSADVLSLAFLLNRRYAPFYKWMHRAARDLPLLGGAVHDGIERLASGDPDCDKPALMESICALLAVELRRQGLSDSESDFLLDHAPQVHERIRDPGLRERLAVVL